MASASLDWLQTLSDSTRVRLLRLLADQELSVSELCSVLQLPQSTVSRHLKVLAADGWLENRREGTNNLYHLNGWCESRSSLWDWVREQAESPTTQEDQQRLGQILSQRSRSEEFFSTTAEQWDNLRIELFGGRIDSFVLAATLSSEMVVAELGCGSAPLCRLAAPFVQEAHAVDSSDAMLRAAKDQIAADQSLATAINIELHQNELTNTDLPNASVDVAWLVLVLPYIDDPENVLSEAKRILKPNGSLVIMDLIPHERSAYRQDLGHVRLGVGKDDLESWLVQADLRLETHRVLPLDPQGKGPALFAAVACGQT
ncbi:MAG: metalloregulator ArsR/SmtB family transcription factor [Planctomycetota bacterium]